MKKDDSKAKKKSEKKQKKKKSKIQPKKRMKKKKPLKKKVDPSTSSIKNEDIIVEPIKDPEKSEINEMKNRLENLGGSVDQVEKIIDVDKGSEPGEESRQPEEETAPPTPSDQDDSNSSALSGLCILCLDMTFSRMDKPVLSTVEKENLKPALDALEEKYFKDLMAKAGAEVQFAGAMVMILMSRFDFGFNKPVKTVRNGNLNGENQDRNEIVNG